MERITQYQKIIEDINTDIDRLLEYSDDEKRRDISDLRKDIAYLRDLLYSDRYQSLGFSKIRIKFYGEYELKLPKYGVESFDRTLKGEMYFKVIGGNDEYIDIKTNSFPDSFRIRLKYRTLEELKNQTGKAFLIYRSGSEKLTGEETKIDFRIIKKS